MVWSGSGRLRSGHGTKCLETMPMVMGTPRTGDKSVIQNKCNSFNSTMMASFLPVIVSNKNKQTCEEKYAFYCSVSQIHIVYILKKNIKKTPKWRLRTYLAKAKLCLWRTYQFCGELSCGEPSLWRNFLYSPTVHQPFFSNTVTEQSNKWCSWPSLTWWPRALAC